MLRFCLNSEVLFIVQQCEHYLRDFGQLFASFFLSLAFLFSPSIRPSVRPFVPAFSLLQELSSVAVLHLTPVPSPVPSPSLPLVRVGVAASIPSSFATAADIHSNSEGLGSLAICKGQGLPFIQQVVFICHISGLSLIVFRLFFLEEHT